MAYFQVLCLFQGGYEIGNQRMNLKFTASEQIRQKLPSNLQRCRGSGPPDFNVKPASCRPKPNSATGVKQLEQAAFIVLFERLLLLEEKTLKQDIVEAT